MANIFKKIGSNALDMAKLTADNSLSQFGMTNIIKDSDYENNAWESASKVMNPIFKTGTAVAAGLIPGASALIGTTQSVGNAVNPINPNQLPDNNGVKTFKKGGELTYYIGNPEQVDGITVANRFKADDGEVSFKRKDGSQYMFSNTLKLPNKKTTFAAAAKKIEGKYKSEDKYDVRARRKELENLADIHEMVRQADEMEQFAKGGMLPGYYEGGIYGDDPRLLAKRNADAVRFQNMQENINGMVDSNNMIKNLPPAPPPNKNYPLYNPVKQVSNGKPVRRGLTFNQKFVPKEAIDNGEFELMGGNYDYKAPMIAGNVQINNTQGLAGLTNFSNNNTVTAINSLKANIPITNQGFNIANRGNELLPVNNGVDLFGFTINPYESNAFKGVSTGSKPSINKIPVLKGKVSTYTPPIAPEDNTYGLSINGTKDMWINDTPESIVKNNPIGTDNTLPTMSKVGMGVQAASTLANGIMMATRKPQYQKFSPLANVYLKRFNPNTALQENKEAFAGAANDVRKVSGSTGQLLANRVNLASNASKSAAGIKQQYEGLNAEVQNKEAMINADIAMKNAEMKLKVGEINAQEYDAIRDQWMNYIDGIANQGAGVSKDVMAYNNAKQYANATQRFKTPNGWFKLNPKTGEFELESKKKGGKV